MSQKVRTLPTEVLDLELKDAIHRLIPLFGVSGKELKTFKEPLVRRVLMDWEHPYHSRDIIGYCFIGNYFYFPENISEHDTALPGEYYHEAGHYIHNMVNPTIINGIYEFLKDESCSKGNGVLRELVAEYGYLILVQGECDQLRSQACRKELEVFKKYGSEFLPRLARMSLEEAIAEDIIQVTN